MVGRPSVDDPFRCRSDGRFITESAGFRGCDPDPFRPGGARAGVLFGLGLSARNCRPTGRDSARRAGPGSVVRSRLSWVPRRTRIGSSVIFLRDGRLCSHRPSGRWPAIGCGRGEHGREFVPGVNRTGLIAWGAGLGSRWRSRSDGVDSPVDRHGGIRRAICGFVACRASVTCCWPGWGGNGRGDR